MDQPSIPFISFKGTNIHLQKEILQWTKTFINNEQYVQGEVTKRFETNFAELIGAEHVVGLSNGMDALELSMKMVGVGKGDEVVVASNAYVASVMAIINVQAVPIFVEPDPSSGNIDVSQIPRVVSKKTKAIMPVHMYGAVCDMTQIMEIAETMNLKVVEDFAQAQGAKWNGQYAGTFGHCNATSFYPTKNLGAMGEAGAITTNDEKIANKLRLLRNYGSKNRYFTPEQGRNARMDEWQAGLLDLKLKYLTDWNNDRKKIAQQYSNGLANSKVVLPLAPQEGHIYHIYVVKCQVDRNKLQSYLKEKGIETIVHYPLPPYKQEFFNNLPKDQRKSVDTGYMLADQWSETVLSLPIYPGLSAADVEYICQTIELFELIA